MSNIGLNSYINGNIQISSQIPNLSWTNGCGYEELKELSYSQISMKKNTKLVKGVEEPIFMKKFNQLYSYLNSIDNDDLILFSGKKKAQYFKIDRKTKKKIRI